MRAAAFVIAFAICFMYTLRVYASVRINEVQIEPQEAIELINTEGQDIDISNWFLDDSGGTTYVTIPDNTLLPAHSCMAFGESFNLNKASADIARLFDSAAPPTTTSAQLIDSLAYTKSMGSSISWQRIPDSTGSAIATSSSVTLWNQSRQSCLATIAPTPSPIPTAVPSPAMQATPTPTLPPSINNIHISEIMANPIDGDEWVELYNDNDYSVTLTKWYIDDVSDAGGSPRPITITISGYGWGSVTFSGSLLNNSGDTVRLLNVAKQEIETVTYRDAPEGESYSFHNGSWCYTTPTKDAPNMPCPIQQLKNIAAVNRISTPTIIPPVTYNAIQPTIHLTLYRIQPESKILGASTLPTPSTPSIQSSSFQKLFSLFAALYCCGTAFWFCYTEWYVSQSKKLFFPFLYTLQRES